MTEAYAWQNVVPAVASLFGGSGVYSYSYYYIASDYQSYDFTYCGFCG